MVGLTHDGQVQLGKHLRGGAGLRGAQAFKVAQALRNKRRGSSGGGGERAAAMDRWAGSFLLQVLPRDNAVTDIAKVAGGTLMLRWPMLSTKRCGGADIE